MDPLTVVMQTLLVISAAGFWVLWGPWHAS